MHAAAAASSSTDGMIRAMPSAAAWVVKSSRGVNESDPTYVRLILNQLPSPPHRPCVCAYFLFTEIT
jgi:uncharacterized protein (DUF1778 family)